MVVVEEVYETVVCDRLRLLTDAVVLDEQHAFRLHRGFVDQIVV